MHTSEPASFPTDELSVHLSYVPSNQPSIIPSYSPTNCKDYFSCNDNLYAIFNSYTIFGYYPFNFTNITINSTTSLMVTFTQFTGK